MATYYVAPDGNDGVSNANNSISSPWRTLHLSCERLSAGDTLIIRGGTYSLPVNGELVLDKANVTVKAHGSERVVVDGRAEWESTWSSSPSRTGGFDLKANPVGTAEFQPLILVRAPNVIVERLTVENSGGEGVRVTAENAQLKSLAVNYTNGSAIRFESGSDGGTASQCTVHKSSRKGTGFSLGCRYANKVTFDTCTVSNGLGEGLSIVQSSGATVTRCTSYDGAKVGLYVDNGVDCVIDGCLVFSTDENEDRAGEHPVGLHITAEEYGSSKDQTDNITVKNNLVVGHQPNFLIQGGFQGNAGANPDWGMMGLRIFHNSFIDATGRANIVIENKRPENNANNTACWFVNNLVVQRDSLTIIATDSATDYSKWTTSNNLWSKSPGSNSPFYNASTDKVADPKLAAGPIDLRRPSDMDPDNYRLVEGSPAIGAGSSAFYGAAGVTVAKDFFGSTRDARPDIGAHEFQSIATQADFSASPLQGPAPLQVTFRDRSVAADPLTSWLWDFGDGSVSNQQNPSHTYTPGTYTVSLRVANATSSSIVTKSNLVSAEAITPDSVPRVTTGLQVLYRFDQRSGNKIFDVSGEGVPLDLVINDSAKVQWTSQGLTISEPTLIASVGPAEKINEACRESNEVTIEAWFTPANKTQDGPARIVSLSQNVHSRNLTLGQGLWGSQPRDLFDVRLRTTERSANGMPSFSSPSGSVKIEKTHVVFTRKSSGLVRIHVNGTVVAESNIPGNLSTWNPRFPLLLGNETTGDYPWLGQLHLVAIFDRFLSSTEVRQNFRAGPQTTAAEAPATVLLSSFKRFMLVQQGTNGFFRETRSTAVAYGVQYPDERCVVCGNQNGSSLTVYANINSVMTSFGSNELRWLD